MGFRTVVMLCNDFANEWENDANLGKKIARAMNNSLPIENYGKVVECIHGDTQTLAVLDGYTMFSPVAVRGWSRGDIENEITLKLLKQAADVLGYRLVKQSKGTE